MAADLATTPDSGLDVQCYGDAHLANLVPWDARLDTNAIVERWSKDVTPDDIKRFRGMVAKAEAKDSTKGLSKLTEQSAPARPREREQPVMADAVIVTGVRDSVVGLPMGR
jgi:hypothetical protein